MVYSGFTHIQTHGFGIPHFKKPTCLSRVDGFMFFFIHGTDVSPGQYVFIGMRAKAGEGYVKSVYPQSASSWFSLGGDLKNHISMISTTRF